MAKRVSAQRVKIHRQYTYESAADTLDVTVQTVRSWRSLGLPVLDTQKPHLILGFELKAFLKNRAFQKSQKLALDEFFCMSCRRPVQAYGGMADYVPYTPLRGRLEALCADCQAPCGKFTTPDICADLGSVLEIATCNKTEA